VALVGRPRLVFLDEPTSHLDPEARQSIWNMIEGLSESGLTFVLTTHHLEEAERLGRRVLLLKAGQIVFDGPPQTMISRAAIPHRISFRLRGSGLPSALAVRAKADGDRFTILSPQPDADLLALRENGVAVEEMRVQSPTTTVS
jgi:ABC-2 type transport system ATP-binding protein